uniref:Secreted protein n=1 Tax=Acrobeloides nanus TaxID=290746 RepID=A0A914DR59_9BILA
MLYYSLILLPTIVHAVYAQLRNNHCYSCTTIDAGRLLSNIEDLNWRRWLDKIRYIPHIEECNDHFVVIWKSALVIVISAMPQSQFSVTSDIA